jgi:ADP-heptose:LPS heptosyltransferase
MKPSFLAPAGENFRPPNNFIFPFSAVKTAGSLSRLLLLRFGGLGDLMAAFPSISLVRKLLPSAALTLACRKEYGGLLEKVRIVDETISSEDGRLLPLFSEGIRPDKERNAWLAGFQIIVGWFQKENILFYRIPEILPSVHCGFFFFDPGSPLPLNLYFFKKTADFLGALGPHRPPFEDCSRFPLIRRAESAGVKFAVVHPGSGSEKKCWPLENFIRAVQFLEEKGFSGAVVTGEAEERLRERLAAAELPEGWRLLHRPQLLELAELLWQAEFYLGNDSGVTHLAASCGTKGLAFFLDENKILWHPAGGIRILSSRSVSEIPLPAALGEITRILQTR